MLKEWVAFGWPDSLVHPGSPAPVSHCSRTPAIWPLLGKHGQSPCIMLFLSSTPLASRAMKDNVSIYNSPVTTQFPRVKQAETQLKRMLCLHSFIKSLGSKHGCRHSFFFLRSTFWILILNEKRCRGFSRILSWKITSWIEIQRMSISNLLLLQEDEEWIWLHCLWILERRRKDWREMTGLTVIVFCSSDKPRNLFVHHTSPSANFKCKPLTSSLTDFSLDSE